MRKPSTSSEQKRDLLRSHQQLPVKSFALTVAFTTFFSRHTDIGEASPPVDGSRTLWKRLLPSLTRPINVHSEII